MCGGVFCELCILATKIQIKGVAMGGRTAQDHADSNIRRSRGAQNISVGEMPRE